jgi:hypothetical protein
MAMRLSYTAAAVALLLAWQRQGAGLQQRNGATGPTAGDGNEQRLCIVKQLGLVCCSTGRRRLLLWAVCRCDEEPCFGMNGKAHGEC